MDKKVLVVDLDGALYNTNTFHRFLKYLLNYYFKHFKLLKFKYLVVLLKLRFLRFISHARLKFEVLKMIENDEIDYQAFVSILSNYKNVIPEIIEADYSIKVLATAAPKYYADLIANENGFEFCLATELPKNGFNPEFENIKIQKRHSIQDFLENKGLSKVDLFITDHIDDLPTIEISEKTIIINPTAEFSNILKKNLINFEVRYLD